LDYWQLNKTNYLVLAILAKRYLAILATSASSEKFFSQKVLNINKLRNRLNKNTFNSIMCLKSWGIINKENIKNTKKREKNLKEARFSIH
jgi:hypothetical protein